MDKFLNGKSGEVVIEQNDGQIYVALLRDPFDRGKYFFNFSHQNGSESFPVSGSEMVVILPPQSKSIKLLELIFEPRDG